MISSQPRFDADVNGRTETLKYTYDGMNVVAEYDESDNLSRRYIHGTQRIDERAVMLAGEGAFVKAECNHFDVHAGPAALELRTADPVLDTQISCGSAGCGSGQADDQIVQLGTDVAGGETR